MTLMRPSQRLQRDYLSPHKCIQLQAKNGALETFQILERVGEGGSAVCYKATRIRKTGDTEEIRDGLLKEYYPLEGLQGRYRREAMLQRLPSGQLVCHPEEVAHFTDRCAAYTHPRERLNEAMRQGDDNQILKNYFPDEEIFQGYLSDEEKQTHGDCLPTIYVWSRGAHGQGFDVYLQEIRRKLEDDEEENFVFRLWEILMTIRTVADAIRGMHKAGLVHLDIKPSNILVFYDSQQRINPTGISLFDLDSIYDIRSSWSFGGGTRGYQAPEMTRRHGRPDHRTDIYSLGAMLFRAIVYVEGVTYYEEKYRDHLALLVRNSRLFRDSQVNSDVKLMSRLAAILENCLFSEKEKRYDSCSQLIADLSYALSRLQFYISSERIAGDGERMVFRKEHSNPTIVMQKLLYEHPLYGDDSLSEETRELRVLVIGPGNNGHKFMDLCLQTGQCHRTFLRLTAVSPAPGEDCSRYLQFRPALPDFVHVRREGRLVSGERKYVDLEDAYAEIDFCGFDEGGASFAIGETALNTRLLRRFFAREEQWDYVFVSLGEDGLSREIAGLIQKVYPQACPVCHVCHEKPQRREDGLYPVWISEELKAQSIDYNLERMAFQTHLCWEASANRDIHQSHQRFVQDTYSYAASLGFALSLKYKLHSIGIDVGETQESYLRAAQEFVEHILDKISPDKSEDELSAEEMDARIKFDSLALLEHRRWIIEKTTEGWKAPEGKDKYEDCVRRGKVNDVANGLHLSLVPRTMSRPLSSALYRENGCAKWEDPDVSGLDPLDRMSVELHQCFRHHADLLRESLPLQHGDMVLIRRELPENDGELRAAFQQYELCLRNILKGVKSYTRKYDRYEARLLEAIDRATVLRGHLRQSLKDRIRLVKKSFFPVIESNLYRNYKDNDERFIRNFPMILTGRFPVRALAVTFADEEGEERLINVASANLLSPAELYYVVYLDGVSRQPGRFIRRLAQVLACLSRRGGSHQVRILAAVGSAVDQEKILALKQGLLTLEELYKESNPEITLAPAELFLVQGEAEALRCLSEAVVRYEISLWDQTMPLLSERREEASCCASFVFDWRKKQFSHCKGCDWLQYIRDNSYLRLHARRALFGQQEEHFAFPELEQDEEVLWEIYQSSSSREASTGDRRFSPTVWDRLCTELRAYEEAREPLAVFSREEVPQGEQRLGSLLLPNYAQTTLQRMLSQMKAYGLIAKESGVSMHSSWNCRVVLKTGQEIWEKLVPLLAQPQYLQEYYGISLEEVPSKADGQPELHLTMHHFSVRALRTEPEEFAEKWDLLSKLEQRGFLRELRLGKTDQGEACVSFTYATPEMKELLTTPGALWAVHTYKELLKEESADEVVYTRLTETTKEGVRREIPTVIYVEGYRLTKLMAREAE